jgi:hypothetical protein
VAAHLVAPAKLLMRLPTGASAQTSALAADPMAMRAHATSPSPLRLAGRIVFLVAGLLALLVPTSASAAVSTFGSPLSVPATLNTAVNLGYAGTNTQILPTAETPSGVYHTYHYGADTAIWNAVLASGDPRASANGQALKVALEGCAVPTPGGPAPLTQIHFQDVSPLAGGGVRVNLTSQPFDIPVCGVNGASGSTVTTYEPTNLCVSRGDFVDFNDEGGYVEHLYQNGVPYRVLGSVAGSTADSFIRGGGTNNGATLSARDTTSMDGFASNPNEELMMQVTLGTGPDANHNCSGGTAGLPPAPPAVSLRAQTDGVNHQRIVAVALYCTVNPECVGSATLSVGSKRYGRATFNAPAGRTTHVPIRVSPQLMTLIRRTHGVSALLTVTVGSKTFTQTVVVKIY